MTLLSPGPSAPTRQRVLFLASVFFLAQVVQEIAYEAVVSHFPDAPPGTPYLYTAVQFILLVLVAQFCSLCCVPAVDASTAHVVVGRVVAAKTSPNPSSLVPLKEEQQRMLESELDRDLEMESSSSIRTEKGSASSSSQSMFNYGVDKEEQSLVRTWLPIIALAGLMFVASGLPNVAATMVEYPVKVVFKSSKLIPTMLVSVMYGNHAMFTCVDYISAVLLCSGAAGFAWGSGKAPALSIETDTSREALSSIEPDAKLVAELVASRAAMFLGVFLLVISVMADAFLSNTQQLLMRRGMTADMLTVRINGIGALVLFIVLLFTGELTAILRFWMENLFFGYYILAGASCTGVGIYCYMLLIRDAGSVVAVAVSTLRKVMTILLSFLLFPKEFTARHLVSSLAVFTGLGLQMLNVKK